VFRDSFLLDCETWEWKRGPEVPELTERVGHTAIAGPAHRDLGLSSAILLFGGQDALGARCNDLKTLCFD
jgi:hypothetical protein